MSAGDDRRGKSTRVLVLAAIVSASVGLTLAVAELAFRMAIFSDLESFERWRRPEAYATIHADPESEIGTDEYWKLLYWFGDRNGSSFHPHPLLGWEGDFERAGLRHHDSAALADRRPVLLYGDSFAECVEESECFQDLLNPDPVFARHHHLLNYGVGGYGVGQIHLLFQHSWRQYTRPFVVFGIMPRDMERTILEVRGGPKPYFEIENGELVLRGTPVASDAARWFDENPPGIPSYLYRLWRNRAGFVPADAPATRQRVERIREVNRRLLEATAQELRAASLDFVFLVFHPLEKGPGGWRNRLIRETLEENEIPYIWSWDLVTDDAGRDGFVLDDYQLPNGHPTTRHNRLIAAAIRDYVLEPGSRDALRTRNRARYRAESEP